MPRWNMSHQRQLARVEEAMMRNVMQKTAPGPKPELRQHTSSVRRDEVKLPPATAIDPVTRARQWLFS
jgi:hypothetical protein